jgi:hypothetical protein
MRILLSIILLFPLTFFGQKTFRLPDSARLDTVRLNRYKVFFVHPDIEYKVSSKQVNLFIIDTSFHNEIENAIRTQYVSAQSKYLDLEENMKPYPHRSMDTTKLTEDGLKQLRRKSILAAARKTVDKDIYKYDRYYFGYITQTGDKWVYILFDPHKIKRYKMSGESHIKNLPTLVYNVLTKQLYLAGWSGLND